MDYARHAAGTRGLRVVAKVDLGSQRQRSDQCDAGQTRFSLQLQAGAKTQSGHAFHYSQRQPRSLGERQAGRDRVADGQVRSSQGSLGLFSGDPGRQTPERGVNSLAAEAIVQQDHERPAQAGFIALLRVEMADGKIERFISGPELEDWPRANRQCLDWADI